MNATADPGLSKVLLCVGGVTGPARAFGSGTPNGCPQFVVSRVRRSLLAACRTCGTCRLRMARWPAAPDALFGHKPANAGGPAGPAPADGQPRPRGCVVATIGLGTRQRGSARRHHDRMLWNSVLLCDRRGGHHDQIHHGTPRQTRYGFGRRVRPTGPRGPRVSRGPLCRAARRVRRCRPR